MVQKKASNLLVLSTILMFCFPSYGLTKATVRGQVLSTVFEGDPSCAPGPIVMRAGVYDFSPFLSSLTTPLDANADWSDTLPWLSPSFSGLLFEDTLTIPGVDIANTPSGTPYEFDISPLVEWCRSHNPAKKPLGFVFLTIGGEGKINLYSDESFATHDTARLIGVSLETDEKKTLFRHDLRTWKSITGSMQYTGHNRQNIRYKNASFVIGGHHRKLPDGTYVDKDRCAFLFHRGLAGTFGWVDNFYDTLKPALLSVSVLDRTSSSASILILTDKETRSLLSWGTGLPGLTAEKAVYELTHRFMLKDLSDSTRYYFEGLLADGSGNTLMTPMDSFMTLAKRPLITGVSVTAATALTANLSWKTATPARCKVLFGLQGHINTFTEVVRLDTVHATQLRNLQPKRTYEFIVIAADTRGFADTSAGHLFTTPSDVSADLKELLIAKGPGLSQNHPNPFNGSTTFHYLIPEGLHGSPATITVRNASGQMVYRSDCVSTPGAHGLMWMPSDLHSGVYVAELTMGKLMIGKKKMICVK